MTTAAPPIPMVGGNLDFNANGVAGCTRCGWRGVATIVDGVESTFCPVCERDPDPAPAAPLRASKTSRNAPCPCGSGVKFKKCCGR